MILSGDIFLYVTKSPLEGGWISQALFNLPFFVAFFQLFLDPVSWYKIFIF